MRNDSQEVARAATQRTRDLDNKGNNHVLLVRWDHPMLIDLPDLPILRVFREYTRRLGTRLHHVLREALVVCLLALLGGEKEEKRRCRDFLAR